MVAGNSNPKWRTGCVFEDPSAVLPYLYRSTAGEVRRLAATMSRRIEIERGAVHPTPVDMTAEQLSAFEPRPMTVAEYAARIGDVRALLDRADELAAIAEQTEEWEFGHDHRTTPTP